MRKKSVDIRTMQAQERIEAKIDFMLRAGGINPDTLEPLGSEKWKEPEVHAGQDEDPPVDELTPERLAELTVKPEDQAIAVEPPVEVEPVAETEDKPKSRSRR